MKPNIALVLTISCLSCREASSSHPTLDAEQFLNAYTALLESKIQTRDSLNSVPASMRTKHILESFGATEEQYRATVQACNADVSGWNDFFERAVKRLEEKDKKKMVVQ